MFGKWWRFQLKHQNKMPKKTRTKRYDESNALVPRLPKNTSAEGKKKVFQCFKNRDEGLYNRSAFTCSKTTIET